MKKVISMLVVITMFFTLATACNKDKNNPTIDTDTTTDVFSGKLLKPYVEINKTGKYMISTEMVLEGGVIIPVTITISGSAKKMLTLTMTMEDGTKLPISLVINSASKMLMFSSLKTYGQIGDTQLKELSDFLQGAYIQLSALSFVGAGTVDIDGVSYKYEDYTNPTSQQISRFVFKDGALVMRGSVDAGVVSAYGKISI
ncbi:MAG: hypothetical protein RR343_02120, partial [Oscillospiraceae bacterium]